MEGSVGLAFQGEGREQLVQWWGQQVPGAQGAPGGVAGFESGEFGWGGSQRASWTSPRRLDSYPVYPARRHLLFSTGNEMIVFGFQQDWKQGSQLGVCICCLGKRSRGRGAGAGAGEREKWLGSGDVLGRTNRTWVVQHQKESGVPPVSALGYSVQGDAIAKMVKLSVLI